MINRNRGESWNFQKLLNKPDSKDLQEAPTLSQPVYATAPKTTYNLGELPGPFWEHPVKSKKLEICLEFESYMDNAIAY
jgi:hypothetical protein